VILHYQEYSLRVQSGCIPDHFQHVTKRYSEFAELNTVLKGYGTDFSLPPKKVFGKMDSDFIEQRQRDLQVSMFTVVWQFSCPRICILALVLGPASCIG